MDVEFNSASNVYPDYLKNKKYLKKRDDDYPQNKKYLKEYDDDIIIMFFQVFLVFGLAGSIKSMQCGYALDAELNSTSNELSC